MPPLLRGPTLFTPAPCPKQMARVEQMSRAFSSTSRSQKRMVRARRMMFQWLGNQGRNFLHPLQDSTNYLGAYAPNGSLKRVVERNEQNRQMLEKLVKQAEENPDKQEELEIFRKESAQDKELPLARNRDLQPFPANKDFQSQPVLGPLLQKRIWEDVMVDGKTVREVSAHRGVEMSRVAAVVRLLEVEQQWKKQNMKRALGYAEAVIKMLPFTGRDAYLKWTEEDESKLQEEHRKSKEAVKQFEQQQSHREKAGLRPAKRTEFPKHLSIKERKFEMIEARRRAPHESINDLLVLKATGEQIWLPVSESRRFTRSDAATAFANNLQPADTRVPHPELTVMHKEWLAGKTVEERLVLQEKRAEAERHKIRRIAEAKFKREDAIKKVYNGRVMYRIQEIKVEDAGKDGRAYKGVGWRYGAPLMDRAKGDVKIPINTRQPQRV